MTREDVDRVLSSLGVRGNTLIVHAALSSFGHLDGGARALAEALVAAVGESGTLLMPAFTYTETLGTGADGPKPVAFDGDLPVSKEIGATAEAFRRLPGVLRSNHPTHSFAAWGRQAREILSTQRDNNLFGPLKKLNVYQGQVLMLGTTLATCTAVHLAEERLRMPYLTRRTAARINAAGYEERVVLDNVPGCSVAFLRLEDRLDPAKVRSVPLVQGAARKVPVRHLVTVATRALESDPAVFVCPRADCASCAAKREALGAAWAVAAG